MKRTRRRKATEPRPRVDPREYKDPDYLAKPGGPQRLDPPNMFVPLEVTALGDALAAKLPAHLAWPLVMVLRQEIDDNGRSQHRPVFVDNETLGPDYPFELGNYPPTFMDPHVFVRMAVANERVRAVLDACVAKNSLTPARDKLPELLEEVLDEYLAYLIERFAEVKETFTEWLPRHWYWEKRQE